jgi:hypothetical protein
MTNAPYSIVTDAKQAARQGKTNVYTLPVRPDMHADLMRLMS